MTLKNIRITLLRYFDARSGIISMKKFMATLNNAIFSLEQKKNYEIMYIFRIWELIVFNRPKLKQQTLILIFKSKNIYVNNFWILDILK